MVIFYPMRERTCAILGDILILACPMVATVSERDSQVSRSRPGPGYGIAAARLRQVFRPICPVSKAVAERRWRRHTADSNELTG